MFKNYSISRNKTKVPLAIGLTADIKLGSRSSYEVIKLKGKERFIEWDIEPGENTRNPQMAVPCPING